MRRSLQQYTYLVFFVVLSLCISFIYLKKSSQPSSSLVLLSPPSHADRNHVSHVKEIHGNHHHSNKKHKILCWILTSPQNIDSRAKAVNATWAKRCDKTLFFSSKYDDSLPTIALNVSEGRDGLPNKTVAAFTYCYENYGEEFDWFLKADDDTYVIVENLRKFTQNLSASDPLYFGHTFKKYFKQGYASGGAGYVLSKEALRKFVEEGIPGNSPVCKTKDVKNEDVLIGGCMEKLGVKAIDTVDENQKERFLPLDLVEYTRTGFPKWFFDFTKYKPRIGKDCCAEDLISIHYVRPVLMYVYDMLINRVKVDQSFRDDKVL